MTNWQQAQEWEASWWGDCTNTLGEEIKQLAYAKRMGLEFFHDGKSPYNIDMGGRTVLDIGGGPCSLLLKCVNVSGSVVDPLPVPEWVKERYRVVGVTLGRYPAEEIDFPRGYYDECWIYNCLQHTSDPALVIGKARAVSKLIRLFEWIDTPTNEGHPHSLDAATLDHWLGGVGKTEILKGEGNCYGACYYGIFPTV